MDVHTDIYMFWSSGILTGNQTRKQSSRKSLRFWSSGILTGNQTVLTPMRDMWGFWSSGILTGNQTVRHGTGTGLRFGAVAF